MDNELRNALRREEPPEGFADRVVERAAPTRLKAAIRLKLDPPSRGLTVHTSPVRWAAAAAVIVALAGGGVEYRARQRERAEGEAARARVVLALHIASSKLQLVQTKIARMHEQPGKNSNQ